MTDNKKQKQKKTGLDSVWYGVIQLVSGISNVIRTSPSKHKSYFHLPIATGKRV